MSADTLTPRRTTPPSAADRREHLAGTRRLVRLALRRDRVRIPVWALSIAALIGYFGAVIPVVYPDQAAMQTRAAIMREPSGAFMTGPGYGLDTYSFGAMLSNEMLGMLAAAAGLMSLFLVVRHTRAEEETGRLDLVRAGVVGRYAPLTAAFVDVLVANAAVTALLLAALVGNGLAPADSLAMALGVGLVGLVFGAVAGVTAQLTEHGRTAAGLAGAVLGLAYVLRGVGDAQELEGGSVLSWLSPIGWAQQTRAFVDLRWWPLALCLALALALVPVAYRLALRRDVGAGLLSARRGRPEAARSLLTPFGLTFRLERGSLYGWAVGLAVFALLTGSMGEGIVESFEAQPQLAEVFGAAAGGDLLRATMSSMLSFFAMAVAVAAVLTVNHLRREEAEGRAETVLATAVGRPGLLGAALGVASVHAVLLLLVSGLGLGAGLAASAGEPALVLDFTVAALVHLPVVLAFAGLSALVYGLGGPTWWVWVPLVAAIVIGLYGPALNLPDVVVDAAPFGLVPQLPGAAMAAGPVLAVTAAAAALVVAALGAFRRRDVIA